MKVVAIRYVSSPAVDGRLFAALGLRPEADKSDDRWVQFSADATFALHQSSDEFEPGRVDLTFEVDEPLAAVEARLVAAGYAPRIVQQPWATVLEVVDGDGQIISVSSTAS